MRITAALAGACATLALSAGTAAGTGKPTTPGGAKPATTGQGGTAVPPPAGSSCGQTIDLPPRRSLGVGGAPLAIGDSVLYDAAQPLADYGFHVNAMICRTTAQGLAWLSDHERTLPVLVVVELGTNGGTSTAQLEQLLTILGPHRIAALVTPHHGTDTVTAALYRYVARHDPYRIELLDWDRISASHPDWFAPDGIHLGGSAGIDAFSRLLASALLGPSGGTQQISPSTPSTTIQPATPTPGRPRSAGAGRGSGTAGSGSGAAGNASGRSAHASGTADHPLRPSQHSIDDAATTLGAAEAICLSLARG